ncbi:MAG: hypothetical protein ACTSRG_12925 [Candidatus Helarchaeota archaeon]
MEGFEIVARLKRQLIKINDLEKENKKLKEAIDIAPCEYKHACLEGAEEWEISAKKLKKENSKLKMRYIGVLGLLCEASVSVPEEIRESIECALEHACEDKTITYKRVLNRFEIIFQ